MSYKNHYSRQFSLKFQIVKKQWNKNRQLVWKHARHFSIQSLHNVEGASRKQTPRRMRVSSNTF